MLSSKVKRRIRDNKRDDLAQRIRARVRDGYAKGHADGKRAGRSEGFREGEREAENRHTMIVVPPVGESELLLPVDGREKSTVRVFLRNHANLMAIATMNPEPGPWNLSCHRVASFEACRKGYTFTDPSSRESFVVYWYEWTFKGLH